MTATLQDRFRGALLGTFVGDVLGRPLEGLTRAEIQAQYGPIGGMVASGEYTDDTQLMIALAEALCDAQGALDLDRIARAMGEAYEPARGYGRNAGMVLGAIQQGTPWAAAAARYAPRGGSFGNGAAMRAAPVALAFFPDLQATLQAASRQSAVTGHRHPLGSFGAQLVALGVHAGLAGEEPAELPRRALALEPPPELVAPLEWVTRNREASEAEAIAALGNDVRAMTSVPFALWCFVSRRDDPEAALVRAVACGGDADTVGAMTGALIGARHGASAFPPAWVVALENEGRGRDYVLELADELFELWERRAGTGPGAG